MALEVAEQLPEEPTEPTIDLGSPESPGMDAQGLQITGLRTVGGMTGSAGRFSSLFSGSDDSSSDEGSASIDEDEAGRDHTVGRLEGDYEDDAPSVGSEARKRPNRRPSTTTAKERTPLYDDDEDELTAEDLGEAIDAKMILGPGPFVDPADPGGGDSSDDELVEIRPRRTSS